MEVGLITESNIVYPAFVFFHLIIKSIAHFCSSLLILFSQLFLNMNVIRKKIQVSFNKLLCSSDIDPTLGSFVGKLFLDFQHIARRHQPVLSEVLAPQVRPDLGLSIL